MFKFLVQIIRSNTGYSSKTLTMLWAMAVTTVMLLSIVLVLLIDLFGILAIIYFSSATKRTKKGNGKATII